MRRALVRFGVRRHARPECISKRAPSTTRTSLRLESTTRGRTQRQNANCVRRSNVSRSLTGFSSIAACPRSPRPCRRGSRRHRSDSSFDHQRIEPRESGTTVIGGVARSQVGRPVDRSTRSNSSPRRRRAWFAAARFFVRAAAPPSRSCDPSRRTGCPSAPPDRDQLLIKPEMPAISTGNARQKSTARVGHSPSRDGGLVREE
jgi:hypothetical protein